MRSASFATRPVKDDQRGLISGTPFYALLLESGLGSAITSPECFPSAGRAINCLTSSRSCSLSSFIVSPITASNSSLVSAVSCLASTS